LPAVPKLPGIGHKDAVRVLQKLGFRIARQSGPIVMTDGRRRVVIPRASPINAFTMGGIAKDAALSPEDFRGMM
jgi:predicted RNA binding protein YcfA (HicA-like mRNA interferase family)